MGVSFLETGGFGMTHLLPRFTEPPRLSAAEQSRWDELDRLRGVMADIDLAIAKLELGYPGLTMPDLIASACDRLDEAGDLLAKRRNALEDGCEC
jgi:hypothetical protein